MGKVISLQIIANESYQIPFPVILTIRDEKSNNQLAGVQGQLPAIEPLKLKSVYEQWKESYHHLDVQFCAAKSGKSGATSIKKLCQECEDASQELRAQMKSWLSSDKDIKWNQIREAILSNINDSTEEIRVLIETQDVWLQRLPWQEWDILSNHGLRANVAMCLPEYRVIQSYTGRSSTNPRVLAILGDPRHLTLGEDKQALIASIPNIKIIVEPNTRQLQECIRDENGWDFIFFSGHSSSQESEKGEIKGKFDVAENISISIDDLKFAFQKAIGKGLKAVIFNSCDGVGLAHNLMRLNIPQVVVMREAIPDIAARQFLKDFLESYSKGIPMYQSVREAGERLEHLEIRSPQFGQFPGVSWLPVIFQNQSVSPSGKKYRGKDYVEKTIRILINKGCQDCSFQLQTYQEYVQSGDRKYKYQYLLRIKDAVMYTDPLRMTCMKGEWSFLIASFSNMSGSEFITFSGESFKYCRNIIWQTDLPNHIQIKSENNSFDITIPMATIAICFAIAIVDRASNELKQYVQTKNPFDLNDEYYASTLGNQYGVPVLYVTQEDRIYYFDQPTLGDYIWNAETAWKCIRPIIEKYLHP